MSHPIFLIRQATKAIGVWLFVVLIMLMSTSAVMAQGLNGAGTIFLEDGTKGHFLLGSFHTKASCQEKVFNMIEYLKDQAQWTGENITYRIYSCDTGFQNGTIYNDLKNLIGLKHYMLFHPNLRMMIVSPQGRDAEKTLCSDLAGYFKTLLGTNVVCVSPQQ